MSRMKIEVPVQVAAGYDKLYVTMKSGNPPTEDFLKWIAERLVVVHDEDPHVDYVQHLRWLADQIGDALSTIDKGQQ